MSNNRKRTRGRIIQTIKVPTTLIEDGVTVINGHPKTGRTIQIKHKPIRNA